MPAEIELKLALDRRAAPRAAELRAPSGGRGRAHGPHAHRARRRARTTTRHRFALEDAGVALRLRRDGARFVQTVKGPPLAARRAARSTRATSTSGGLRARASIWRGSSTRPGTSSSRRRRSAAARAAVHDRRRAPHVAARFPDGTTATLAIDVGAIRARGPARPARGPIAEIEIELGQGIGRLRLRRSRLRSSTIGRSPSRRRARPPRLRARRGATADAGDARPRRLGRVCARRPGRGGARVRSSRECVRQIAEQRRRAPGRRRSRMGAPDAHRHAAAALVPVADREDRRPGAGRAAGRGDRAGSRDTSALRATGTCSRRRRCRRSPPRSRRGSAAAAGLKRLARSDRRPSARGAQGRARGGRVAALPATPARRRRACARDRRRFGARNRAHVPRATSRESAARAAGTQKLGASGATLEHAARRGTARGAHRREEAALRRRVLLAAGPRQAHRAYLKALARLQDALGHWHDAVTATRLAAGLAAQRRRSRRSAPCAAGSPRRSAALEPEIAHAWQRFAAADRSGRAGDRRCESTASRRALSRAMLAAGRSRADDLAHRSCRGRRRRVPARARDDDRTAISGTSTGSTRRGTPDAPLVVLFHGLEGSSHSHYARALMAARRRARAGAASFRIFAAAAASSNLHAARVSLRRPRRDRRDARRHPRARAARMRSIHAAGISLGGSALLNWLGRAGRGGRERARVGGRRLHAARPRRPASTSTAASTGSTRGISCGRCKPKSRGIARRYPGDARRGPRAPRLLDVRIRRRGHRAAARLRGHARLLEARVEQAMVPAIAVPTLVLNAKNDPFVPARSLPGPREVSRECPARAARRGRPLRLPGRTRFPGGSRGFRSGCCSFSATGASLRLSRTSRAHADATLPPEIFKAYDIRGIVGSTLTPEIVRAVGQALGIARAGTRTRHASSSAATAGCPGPTLGAALAEGIRASGANVIDVGMVATPMTLLRRASARHRSAARW